MVGTIVTVVFQLIEWWLKRQSDNAQALSDFYKFVHTVNVNYMDGVAAGKAWRDQAKALADELDRRAKPPDDGMVPLVGGGPKPEGKA